MYRYIGKRVLTSRYIYSTVLSQRWYSLIERAEFSHRETGVAEPGSAEEPVEERQPEEEDTSDTPWYLREDVTAGLGEQKVLQLPQVPANAPEAVSKFVQLLGYDYGIDDIELFDLTTLEENHDYSVSNQAADYIIIGTGKSEKHLYKAANELKLNIKHSYGEIPRVEGMVNSAQSPTVRRRMLKRARKGAFSTDNEYGKPANSWIMCDTYVDNVFIHLLTQKRRQELMLETLWCQKEDLPKYTSRYDKPQDSDDIFIGIRRYHTTTPFSSQIHSRRHYSTQVDSIQSILTEIKAKELDTLDETFMNNCLEGIVAKFLPDTATLADYKTRETLYQILHNIDPNIVTFDKVNEVSLEKYSNLNIALDPELKLDKLKTQDIVDYMKLLLDSPELKQQYSESKKEYVEELFDKLANHIVHLFQFSSFEISLADHPHFIPLLWRMCSVGDHILIGSRTIDEIIYQNQEIPTVSNESPVYLATSKARSIIDLIDYYNTSTDNMRTSNAFHELVLFSYGNASNWKKFWNQWNTNFKLTKTRNEEYTETAQTIRDWVRLIVYLATRNDKAQMIYFLNNHWDVTSSIGGSFVHDFSLNEGKFNSEAEKIAFVKAIRKMLDSINLDENNFFAVVEDFLQSVQ